MNKFSHSDINWNDLPNEIKVIVVRNLELSSRFCLRACSRKDQQIVDSVPLRTVHYLVVYNEERCYKIEIWSEVCSGIREIVFDSFETFQARVTEELDGIDYVKTLRVFQVFSHHRQENKKYLKISIPGRLAKIRNIFFDRYSEDPASILEQVDPDYLKKMELRQYHLDSEIFNMLQVINADSIFCRENHIGDDQLLQLNATEITLWGCRRITAKGLNEFIKKCLRNLDAKQVAFRIFYDHKTNGLRRIFKDLGAYNSLKALLNRKISVKLDSSSPKFQLEVIYQSGVIHGRTIRKISS